VLADHELTEAERQILRDLDAPGGFGTVVQGGDPEVRASLLVELLTDRGVARAKRIRPLLVKGARITGNLDLRSDTLVRQLLLIDCEIEEAVNLFDARTLHFGLLNCRLPSITAQRAHIGGSFDLRDTRMRFADLFGMRVDNQLLLSGAQLANPDGIALQATGITVGQGMHCGRDHRGGGSYGEPFVADGQLDLSYAQIGWSLFLNGARLRHPGQRALEARQLTVERELDCSTMEVDGDVNLYNATVGGELSLVEARLGTLVARGLRVGRDMQCGRFQAGGEVNLIDANIGANLVLTGARLCNAGGMALNAGRITVGQDVFCTDRFLAKGNVFLGGARIGGLLNFNGGWLRNPEGYALDAESLVVGQSMLCTGGFVARGSVQLAGAQVGDSLVFTGGALLGGVSQVALNAEHVVVGGSLRCWGGIRAVGHVSLTGARVGRYVDLGNARLTNPGGRALDANSLRAEGALFGRQASVSGEVWLVGAQLGELDLNGATLTNPSGDVLVARGLEVDQDVRLTRLTTDGDVFLRDARIGGRLRFDHTVLTGTQDQAVDLTGVRAVALGLRWGRAPAGMVDLSGASVGSIDDDPASWPARLRLRGLTYLMLDNEKVGVAARLGWLARQDGGFAPGPYDQLAAHYRQTGHVEDARRVGYAKQRRRRAAQSVPGRVWSRLLQVTVGYGYRTWLAGVWLLGLLAVGSVVFAACYPADLIAAQPHVPRFQPVAYALDVLLPIVDLGQQSAWLAQGPALLCSWLLTVAGWILATLVITGVTNALQRD
jgi:hypothetical protein